MARYEQSFDYRLRLLLDYIQDNPGKPIPQAVADEARDIKNLAGTFNDFRIVHVTQEETR